MLSIGLMSGTSMDGIDAALLRTDGENLIAELGHVSVPYDSHFKCLLHAAQYWVKHCQGHLHQVNSTYATIGISTYLQSELKKSPEQAQAMLTELRHYLSSKLGKTTFCFDAVIQHSTELHGAAVNLLLEKTGRKAGEIKVIGYHGQALYHQPSDGISIVVGHGQWLANYTNIPVINDFRSNDIAAGGQGAPFAPLYHHALAMRDDLIPAAVVNCGGIANITLMQTANVNDLIGFDTGPGNGLIDRLVTQRTQGAELLDQDGKYGLQGKINPQVLVQLRNKALIKNGLNYFTMPPPKSLDFGDLQLIDALAELTLEDACATLEAFTAETIVNSLDLLTLKALPNHWILAGGGWNNPVIYRELTTCLTNKIGSQVVIHYAHELGWNSQALEAQIFAYLAVRSLQGKPLSVPGTTRVPRPLTGGVIYQPADGGRYARPLEMRQIVQE